MFVNAIAFSKDRPAQLDLLLQTFKKFFCIPHSIRVIASASSHELKRGYECVQRFHPLVDIFFETKTHSFASLLRRELIPATHLMFLVDDLIFLKEVASTDNEVRQLADPDVMALSLRLGKRIRRCYAQNYANSLPPRRDSEGRWAWRQSLGDWGYGVSLDGDIFRTEDLYPLLRQTEAYGPNVLEVQLNRLQIKRTLKCCYDDPRVVNVPHNRVQSVYRNKNMGNEVEELNNRFIKGDRLAYEHLIDCTPDTVHAELPLRFASELCSTTSTLSLR